MRSHDHALAVELYGECPYCQDKPAAPTPEAEPAPHPLGDGRPVPDFDGGTYRRPLDHVRLASQLYRVHTVMGDGQWRTLGELAAEVGATEPAVSARLRDLRKPKYGGFHVEHRRRGDPTHGLWEYRLAGHRDT